MKKTTLYYSLLVCLLSIFHFSTKGYGSILLQSNSIYSVADSLIRLLGRVSEDTAKVKTLNDISWEYLHTGDYDKGIAYANSALQLAEKINDKKGIGDAYTNIGVGCWYTGVYDKALENHQKALAIRVENRDLRGVGNSYNNVGLVYVNMADYEKSLTNYLKALRIKEELGDKKTAANTYNNIGVIYDRQGNFDKALENYEKALQLRLAIADKRGIGMSYNNIGIVYFGKKEFAQALKNLMMAIVIREEIGDKKGLADSYVNTGNVYFQQQKYEKAQEYYFKAAGIDEHIGNKRGVALCYSNIGTCYLKQNDLQNSLLYLQKAEKALKELGGKDVLVDTFLSLSELYKMKGDYKQAFEYQCLYADLKDTLFDERTTAKMLEMNTKYESEKKDKDLIKKDAEIIRQQAEADRQRLLRNVLIAGIFFVLVFSFFIFRAYRQKQIANKMLDRKNELITDSITYAKSIQESIFPSDGEIQAKLPDFFAFHLPKDIISGDFYWFSVVPAASELLSPNVMLAAVDCTGHGVPGALMSMMAYNFLEEIVKKRGITEPADVLQELNLYTIEALRQKNGHDKLNDGMDAALIKLIASNENEMVFSALEYAGAKNALYIVRNGQLQEWKADRVSLGFFTNDSHSFKNHYVKLQKGDCIYLFTDGFPDQFGEATHEKFYYQPFRELLIRISPLSMSQQKQELQKAFVQWKGNENQTDDVFVLGVRV